MAREAFRPPELERFKSVWLTEEAHQALRREKKRQKKSIARLVDELILDEYVKDFLGKDE